ncbi:MAG: hypothetical protein NTY37_07050 [Methanothrix sp.]|nr:hypothetical protein [Methanothrix sp.]
MTCGRSPSRPSSPVGGGQAGPVPGSVRSLTGAGARASGGREAKLKPKWPSAISSC